jgi:hypothetical protein
MDWIKLVSAILILLLIQVEVFLLPRYMALYQWCIIYYYIRKLHLYVGPGSFWKARVPSPYFHGQAPLRRRAVGGQRPAVLLGEEPEPQCFSYKSEHRVLWKFNLRIARPKPVRQHGKFNLIWSFQIGRFCRDQSYDFWICNYNVVVGLSIFSN